jgi:hypothetical protein
MTLVIPREQLSCATQDSLGSPSSFRDKINNLLRSNVALCCHLHSTLADLVQYCTLGNSIPHFSA